MAAERPDAILVAEQWRQLPSLEGYSRSFEAQRQGTAAGRGGGAQMWADGLAAQVVQWRSRPDDSVLWARISGSTPSPLFVGLCYLPPKGSGGCPADLDSWWLRLAWQMHPPPATSSLQATSMPARALIPTGQGMVSQIVASVAARTGQQ